MYSVIRSLYPKETEMDGTGISVDRASLLQEKYSNKTKPYDLLLNSWVAALTSFQDITAEVPIFILQQIYSFQLLLEANAPCHTQNSPLLYSFLSYLIYPRFHRFISDRSASKQLNYSCESQCTHTLKVTVCSSAWSSLTSHI